eukprot:TRINITY_DN16735_c0_g2_i1.p1 TRINITY_DN16735_c0_g2~~TRINITY_DN16735_c0_g2_i1.p1  ORF type:complete len:755 (-),score=122.16 TRINITY_DN16735_c0_g2_i1:173-2437(-)
MSMAAFAGSALPTAGWGCSRLGHVWGASANGPPASSAPSRPAQHAGRSGGAAVAGLAVGLLHLRRIKMRRLRKGRRMLATLMQARGGNMGSAPLGGMLVLCGPSGVGKSTLVKRLLDDEDLGCKLALVVSHTTRTKRDGEVDGTDYHFLQRPAMEKMIAEGLFLEYAEVHGNLYGTSWAAIDDVRSRGCTCVLDVDVAGVRNLRTHISGQRDINAHFVLVTPEGGLETLDERLRSRGSDDEASIQRRLETARKEMEAYASCTWDSTIVSFNGKVERSFKELRRIAVSLADGLLHAPGARIPPAVAEDGPTEAPEPCLPGAPQKNVFGEFSGLARALGDSCVDLGQGFPNFDPPEFVVQALRDELTSSVEGPRTRHQYTRTAGHVPLVEVLAERYSHHLGRPLDAMQEVAVTVGATNGLFLAMQAALSRSGPGARQIVALEPFFELYRSQANGLNAEFCSVPLRFDADKHCFELDSEALAAALGPKTAALIVNTPHNPTGKAFEENELRAIADIVRQHPHILVISDEVYKYMIFDPPEGGEADEPDKPAGHVHFARLPGMWQQTITVSSAGKTFGITGWQIGWLIGPSEWLQPIQRFMPNLQFCAPTLTQRALCRVLRLAAEPYDGAPSYYSWLRQDYARRREIMVSALQAAGITTARSQGGFFLLGDISGLCGPDGPLSESWEAAAQPDEPRDWAFCRALAAKLGIVSLPVSPFFGPLTSESVRTRFARFCFAKTDATLAEAGRRLQRLSYVKR